MNDKKKHFLACLAIALLGFSQSLFAGLYGATLCAFLREYDRYAYTGKQDKTLDFLADLLGIITAIIIAKIGGLI